MKFVYFPILFFFIIQLSFSQEYNIKGRVTSQENLPLENVHVIIKGTTSGVYTNTQGLFDVKVSEREILVFSYIGMQTVEILIISNKILNVELIPEPEELNSVLVKKRRAFTQKELLAEYHFNKNLIKTSMGIIDKDRASFSIRIIDGEELAPVGTDFLYSLQNLYPTMIVDREDKNLYQPKVYLQNWSYGSRPQAIFDVDGVIYEQAPTFIEVHNIDRIAILVRNGAVARYGPAGVGGVIIINTKSRVWKNNDVRAGNYDNSKLRDSIDTVLNLPSTFISTPPIYIEKLEIADNEERAYKEFRKSIDEYGDSPYYFIDVASYIYNKWGSREKAVEILEHVSKKISNDIEVLKALAFKYEELNYFELTFSTYLLIYKLRPMQDQALRDLAMAYFNLGNYKRSLSRYLNYKSVININKSPKTNKEEVDYVMDTELAHIVKLYGKDLDVSEYIINSLPHSPETRVLFEWTREMEFEIGIIDANNNYYSWRNYTSANQSSNSNNELDESNSTCKEFFFDDEYRGSRQVRISYSNDYSQNPTYLKATVFFNYGKSNEKSRSLVFRISKKVTNYQLFEFNVEHKKVTK